MENRLNKLMSLAADHLDEPAVEVIQPEVRTGSQYALLPSMQLDDDDEEETL